jgi:aspartyl-tRNA synthetase
MLSAEYLFLKFLNQKDLEALTETTKQNRVNILAFAKWSQNEWSGSIASKLNDAGKSSVITKHLPG